MIADNLMVELSSARSSKDQERGRVAGDPLQHVASVSIHETLFQNIFRTMFLCMKGPAQEIPGQLRSVLLR